MAEKRPRARRTLKTSKVNGHAHTWTEGSRFTSTDNGHRHRVTAEGQLLEAGGHRHRLLKARKR